jgi:hypothetical protein
MNPNSAEGRKLIAAIDKQFINVVGPIGQILIEEAKSLWRQKQWSGPSALRNYVKALSSNIDTKADKESFVQQTSQIVMDAAAAQNR